MMWLGMAKPEQWATMEQSAIGTEHLPRSIYETIQEIGDQELDELIAKVHARNPLRAGLLSHYFAAMDQFLAEGYRVLTDNGVLVLVIGDTTASGYSVPNHDLLRRRAERLGFVTKLVARDVVKSRVLITKRNTTAGLVNEDWVMVLEKE